MPNPNAESTASLPLCHKPQHRSLLICFALAYFFLHATLYASHNFRQLICEYNLDMPLAKYGFVDMLSLLKFVGSLGSTWLSERVPLPLAVPIASTMLFSISLGAITSPLCRTLKFASLVVYIITESAVLPVVDAECLRVLESTDTLEKFSLIRMFSSAGHSTTYLLNALLEKAVGLAPDKSISVNTGICGVLSIISLFLVAALCPRSPKRSEDPQEKESSEAATGSPKEAPEAQRKYLFGIAQSSYVLILFCVVTSGLSRTVLQSYLPAYLNMLGLRGEANYIYFFRTATEFIVWSCALWIGDRVSLELLFPTAILLGAVRSCMYYAMDVNARYTKVSPYFVEMLKSIYSTLFIYTSIRLAKKYAKKGHEALAQGLFTAFYSGLAPFIAGTMECFLLGDPGTSELHSLQKLFLIVGLLGVASSCVGLSFYFKQRLSKGRQ